MKKYEELTLKIICLEREDVIMSSMIDSDGDGVYDGEIKEPEIWG